jgi:hypothetical protein
VEGGAHMQQGSPEPGDCYKGEEEGGAELSVSVVGTTNRQDALGEPFTLYRLEVHAAGGITWEVSLFICRGM